MSEKTQPTTTKASVELLRKLIYELQFNPSAERYYNTCLQRERRTTAAARRTTVRELLVRYSGRILGHEISPMNSNKQLARNGIDVVALEHIRRALDTAWKMPYVEPHQGSGYDLSAVPDIDWATPLIPLDYTPEELQAVTMTLEQPTTITLAQDIEHTKVDAILSAPHWFKALSSLSREDLANLKIAAGNTDGALSAVAAGITILEESLETPFQTYLKEVTMRTIPAIEVTTRTFVNGTDISTMSKADIYGLIRDQEKHIEELKAIQNKPASLQREITQRQKSIQSLVDYLDKQDPVQVVASDVRGPAYATATAPDMPIPEA